MEELPLYGGDPHGWVRLNLWQQRRRQLAAGEVQLEGQDLGFIFSSLLGPGKVLCGACWAPGWTHLVYTVLEYISLHNKYGDPSAGNPIKIDQIKEKFGGLRIYYSGGYEHRASEHTHKWWPDLSMIEGIVEFADSYSERIDFNTGRTDDLVVTQGWISVQHKDNVTREARPFSWTYSQTEPR